MSWLFCVSKLDDLRSGVSKRTLLLETQNKLLQISDIQTGPSALWFLIVKAEPRRSQLALTGASRKEHGNEALQPADRRTS